MTTYETPGPISVTLEIGIGRVRVIAADREDTVVEISPSNPARRSDVAAAELAQVEYSAGRLSVRAAKGWRQYRLWRGRESIEVRVDLPAGSNLAGEAGVASLAVSGRIGEVDFRTGMGDVHLDETGPLRLRSGMGAITVGRVAGPADIKTGSGHVDVGSVDGTAVIKNSNGDTRIGEADGDLRVQSANGRIAVDLTRSTVVAKTANGDI
ncbi:MAG TPA: DUF4097 family beta strand repeat-containing protein, partial [Acidimicrobiales bacterium]|nr:DUF4097 family beta strand repeat-containing protein [Acidimicrobiales bacterium]